VARVSARVWAAAQASVSRVAVVSRRNVHVYVWATAVALIAGVLIPEAMVEALQPGLLAFLAVCVAVAAAVSVAGRTFRRVRARTQRTRAAVPAQRFVPEPALSSEDREVLGRVCGALGSSQLEWLRSNTFVTPWLDARVRGLLELEPLVAALSGRPFSEELQTRVGVFSDALAAFAAFYADQTFPDPLLLGSDWRFFDWNEVANAKPGASSDDLWNGRAATTRSLAAAVSNAYVAFREAAMSDPQVRDRVRAATPTPR
jgi:hypothetical protein